MSTGVGVSECCLSGHLHSGKPTGRVEEIGGLNTYVAEPEGGSKSKTVIFLADIFGWEFVNVRLLADQYAKAGFYVYLPDLHQGDSLPIDFLQNVEPPLKKQKELTIVEKTKNAAIVPATLGPWLVKHREGVTKPLLDGYINTVRHIPGTNKIGAIGFCWGGRYAILEAEGRSMSGEGSDVGGVDAAYACHPSLVSITTDFKDVKVPLSLALGTKDSLLGESERNGLKEALASRKDAAPYEIKEYEDQVHGFALRGDWSSDKDKQAMDAAASQGLQWFEKYLA